ncbi:hypothetical protein INS49_012391 [Diaporthe citri]|uniref:uncharacterized protein n=1 Tax=Diaporthe citri TaxID=83186 RepID=UPI001C819F7B|nr:uncharacterized protein INS49_012391 [Diaporthe citri]KAG6358872.1 hypothetical protein INS49_012391 [Diaporthe citri]
MATENLDSAVKEEDYLSFKVEDDDGDTFDDDYSNDSLARLATISNCIGLVRHEVYQRKMFIGGLNWETTDESLRDYFSQFGEVTECTVMRDGATGRSRGFGFLTFKDPKTVNVVMVKEHYLDGKIIDPKRAIPRDEQEKTSKIFVGGVSQETTDAEFKDYFAQFGRVVDATLMMDKDTGRPRGFGFVTFESEAGVDACLATELEIHGKPIEVKKAQPRGNMREEEEAKGRGNNRFGNRGRGAGNNFDDNSSQGGAIAGGNGGGSAGGPSGSAMAQQWARMQQMFQMWQQQMAMNRGMGGMNPQAAMMQMMQMQQMQQQMMMQAQQQGGAGAGRGGPMPNMGNMGNMGGGQMNPAMMQQMMNQMGGQGGPGGPQGGMQQQPNVPTGPGGNQNRPGYNAYEQQMFEQQKYDQRGGRQGSNSNINQQQGYGMGGGGAPTSWEGMYDDVPQPNVPNQMGGGSMSPVSMGGGSHGGGGGGGGRGGGGFRGRGGFHHQNHQQPADPTKAPPANAPTGPKNAGRPGANYRGGGRGGGARGFHPYGR